VRESGERGAKWEVAYRACGETAEEPSPDSNYQFLVPLELGWQRASRGARRSICNLGPTGIRHPRSAVALAVAVGGGRWAAVVESSSSAVGRGPRVDDLVEWPCERRQKAALSK
jgi:hypothetical protein